MRAKSLADFGLPVELAEAAAVPDVIFDLASGRKLSFY